MNKKSREAKRAELLRAYFRNFAYGGAAPFSMRNVAKSTASAYATVYAAFANKTDLVASIDAALASWMVEDLGPWIHGEAPELRGEPDQVRRLQLWFRNQEELVLAQAFWVSDRIRHEVKRYREEMDEKIDPRSIIDGVCGALSMAFGWPIERARLLVDELHSLAFRRYLTRGYPSIASREDTWRTIIEGTDPRVVRDGYRLPSNAEDWWRYVMQSSGKEWEV